MRKSLIVIASALIFAVAGATHERLRYDSTAFTDVRITGGSGQPAAARDYPPCVRGVREDRCIQLYERGVRRSYERWRAERGGGSQQAAAVPRAGQRGYRACRGRGDDRCQQSASARRARAARPARVQQAQRRAVARHAAAARPARPARASQAVVRQQARPAPRPAAVQRPAVIQRQRPGTPSSAPRPRAPGGTPGI